MWSFFSKDPSKELANFEIQAYISLDADLQQRTIWSLNNAKRKGNIPNNSQPQSSNELNFSAFGCTVKTGNETWLQPAKNCLKRMKMTRHPNVLMFQDGVENERVVQIVTERVQHLSSYLNESKDNESQKLNEISWGLHQIATALTFLNNDCKLVHNNVNISSIVVNKAGDWKLAGFEFSHSNTEQNVPYKVLTSLDCYEPPEKSPTNNLNTNRNMIQTESAVDSFGFGCLIWEIFNGLLPNAGALKNPGKIPKRLTGAYKELISSNPNKRLSPLKFIQVCRQSEGFMDNDFIDTLLFLEQFQIKDQAEKTQFFTDLTAKLDDFPKNLCLFKILPELLNAYEFGNAGSSVMPPLFKLGKQLDDAEYQKKVIPIVVKLFSSTDRATRMRLLQQLHLFVEHLSASIINDQIFPNICQGFSDTNPTIRENTIRAIVLLAPKLNYNNLNVELMKHFARLQGQDEQGMIRTNTTVCIGKIAIFINPQLRQRILLSAFPKAMRDPYPLARLSGIVALANTDRFYTLRDIASKVLPSLCMLTIDPEKDVRDEAFKTIKLYTQKLEKVSENPELALEMEKEVSSCTQDLKNETSWTSWAMTSLSAKMTGYKNKDKGPSVALNTQPLGPPTGMSKENKPITPEKLAPIKETNTKLPTKTRIEPKKPIVENNFNSGWGGNDFGDDDEWKDFDDDENNLMEPLEPTLAKNEPFNSPKDQLKTSDSVNDKNDWSENWIDSFEPTKTSKSLVNSKKSNQIENNDWSNSGFGGIEQKKSLTPKIESEKIDWNEGEWGDSFEPISDKKKPLPKSKTLSNDVKLSSTYNWSKPNTAKNTEEDLFASLVGDVSLTNKSAKPKNESSNDWSTDWNSVENNDSNSNKGTRRSKPLKLGQKKDII